MASKKKNELTSAADSAGKQTVANGSFTLTDDQLNEAYEAYKSARETESE